jgi:hypothetical protein
MKIAAKQLRRLIREEILSEIDKSTQSWKDRFLLEKDTERIFQKLMGRAWRGAEGAATVTDTRTPEERAAATEPMDAQILNTTYKLRDADPVRVANEKEIKRIWAEEVEIEGSRSFFDKTLIKVHWVGGYKREGAGPGTPFEIALNFLKSHPNRRSKDEISCFGYTPAQAIDAMPNPTPTVGIIIKGYTTYASAADAGTHMTSRATDAERMKHAGSGLHKRPGSLALPPKLAQDMIVDEESWANAMRVYHELIVDNWSIDGIIIVSYQKMIDAMNREIKSSGYGKERQILADKIAEKARKEFQELGRLAEETGIPFYDLNLKPIDFSGAEFTAGELESEWSKVLTPGDELLQGTITGDPDVPEVVVEGRLIGTLEFVSLTKPITFRNCQIGNIEFTNMGGALVKIENCQGPSRPMMVWLVSGSGSVEMINPADKNPSVTIWDQFKLKRATFVGCDFFDVIAGSFARAFYTLVKQHKNNGAIITFLNCTNLPPGAEDIQNQLPKKQIYYHGPGREGVSMLDTDEIAKFVFDIRSEDHMVYFSETGAWGPALSSPEVQSSYNKLESQQAAPQLSEHTIRRIIRSMLR